MSSKSNPAPTPEAPGYGDQGPAGGGRDEQVKDEAAEPERKPRPGSQDDSID